MQKETQKHIPRQIAFNQFWIEIGQQTGNVNLPLTINAKSVQEFTQLIDGQNNPLKSIILECYKKAKCTSLTTKLNPYLAMTILGEYAYLEKRKDNVDIYIVDLLEHIGLIVAQLFLEKTTTSTTVSTKTKHSSEQAAIIQLHRH